ncbi:MAG: phosphotransferase [Dehalococcoidia bacterium]|nr:phosphotransferase [Dehalococcoidia bacterium]
MIDLSDLTRAMRSPETYPHETRGIEVVQTQMSVVFLTGQYAYKVKKPVNFGYLDYSTLERRRDLCHRELELNRRLCPDVYMEVAAITELSGKIRLGGSGQVLEYAVKMRQLPRDRMMDELLRSAIVSLDMVHEVAVKLADFHHRADTGKYINEFGETCSVILNTDENFDQTERYVGRSITEAQFRRIREYSNSFLRSHAALMHDRIDEGRIRDCHGDLHAAHVCFTRTGICIYDCIEFNDRLRYTDVASEVAIMAMDLDRFARQDLSVEFVDAYVKASNDQTLRAMLPFYKCYRAYVRGKAESFSLDSAFLPEEHKTAALKNARRYFELAHAYASKTPSQKASFEQVCELTESEHLIANTSGDWNETLARIVERTDP